MMHQVFSLDERSGLQVGQFSTWTLTKPCCCHGHRMWFSTVSLKYGRPYFKNTVWIRADVVLKPVKMFYIDGAFPDVEAVHSRGTNSAPCHLKGRKLELVTALIVLVFVRRTQRFQKLFVHFHLSDHRTVLHFASVHFKRALLQRRQLCLWMV